MLKDILLSFTGRDRLQALFDQIPVSARIGDRLTVDILGSPADQRALAHLAKSREVIALPRLEEDGTLHFTLTELGKWAAGWPQGGATGT